MAIGRFPNVTVPRIRAVVSYPGQSPLMQELVGFPERLSWFDKPESTWSVIEELVGLPEWWVFDNGVLMISHDTRQPEGWTYNMTWAFDEDVQTPPTRLYGPIIFVGGNSLGDLLSLSIEQIYDVLTWIDGGKP